MLTAFDTRMKKGRVGPLWCHAAVIDRFCLHCHLLQDQGLNFSITSACSTSAHCISSGVDAIRNGSQDIVFAGGGKSFTGPFGLFDAMGAMSSKYNDAERASRAYDADRDGFVIAGGGGMVVLEDMEHALAAATIHAEIVGYGANPTDTHGCPVRRRRGALHGTGAGRL